MNASIKIPLIVFSILFGILFIPLAASNLYCDYLTDFCSSRITGVDKILDHCKQKEAGNPIHQYGLSYSNDTHYIDNNTCEWQEKKFVSTTPFGYPRDTAGNYDHCFSYKTDPEYGVEIKNSTHILNPENCEWELENEN